MDMNALNAVRSYVAARPATVPDPTIANIPGAARAVAQDFTQTLQQGEAHAMAAMTGGADPHALVHALAQTELAVETAVAVRDKVVQAYQEILRMPV